MIEARALCTSEKLNLISCGYKAELSPSATKLLHLMIDMTGALMWSSERLAKSIKRSVRTVERALAELRAVGALRTVRRRRQTLVKVLDRAVIHRMGMIGAAASRKACEAAMAARAGLTRHCWRPISNLDILRGLNRVASLARTEKSDATSSLLRSRLGRPG